MGSKKSRKKYEDELALFSHARPAASSHQLESDEAYEAFRRHMEEHIQAETRAFHQLRSEAESNLHQSHYSGAPERLQAAPAQPRASILLQEALPQRKQNKQPPPRAPAQKSAPPQPLRATHGIPPGKARPQTPWINGLLCLSFAIFGGLGYQAWQQWHPSRAAKTASENKSRYQARALRPPSRESMKIKPLASSVAPLKLPSGAAASPAPAASTASPAPAALPQDKQPASSGDKAAICAPSETEVATAAREKALLTGAGELRRGPSLQYEIIDLLPAGSLVEGTLTSDRQWLRLEGGRFLALGQAELLDQSLDANWVDRWVGAKLANIRSLPAMQARILKKLNQGDAIRIAGINKQWAKIEGGGYIYTALLSENDPRPLRLPALMRVTADQATIFTGPGKQFAPVGIYFKNHKVEVLELSDGWFRVGQDQFIKVQDLEQVAQSSKETKQL